ncbi:MAG: FtsK/SpoIIIE family DNA translocase [Planctomycetota bacterium]|jgi:S-DNA-T family DNA segregation ATPase FtsK/SpoIIIE
MGRRLAWVGLAVAWLFLVIALTSFNAADWPSHAVAVHNTPAANLCGSVGALASYWSYKVLGLGTWVVLLGIASYLAVTLTGRAVDQLILRAIGTLLVAVGISSVHGLLLPSIGPLPGTPAGAVAGAIVAELAPRFNTVGSLLLIAAGLTVGAILAADRLVLRLPLLLGRALLRAGRGGRSLGQAMQARPETVAAAPISKPKRRQRRSRGAPIDPDAGGVGATDTFDPEEHELHDDVEADDEEAEADDDAEADRQPLSAEELRRKIERLPVRIGSQAKQVARDEDIPREESFEGYEFPTLDMLADPQTNYTEEMETIVRDQAEQLEKAMHTFGIDGDVVGIDSGPTVSLYAVQLAPGTKVSKISAVASDIARSLRAPNVRIVPNMVGRTTIGIEVPNLKRERVRLKELMSGGEAQGMVLPMFLGKDASGEALVADLNRMPHMLIAGTTGSGKSVCMNSIIMSWLYTKRPDELKLVLVDPKMVELSQFGDIPHLMCPVVTEMPRAAAILEWAVSKMEERYELLSEATVQNVAAYNQLSEEDLYERFQAENDLERARIPKHLPYIVFVIDELADLIMMTKEVEHSIVRIAQKARAVGIHLILATQRPQANVVTGLIKSNMPCRVSFKVASGMDSRIVLDQKGAELLLGQGDMLFLTPHTSEVRRAQSTLVEDKEIRRVVKFLKTVASPNFERSLIAIRPGVSDEMDETDARERDPMFDRAVEVMIESGRGSVSLLQRRLAIGYSRASRLVDQMHLAGIVGDHKGSVAREILITLDDWKRMKAMEAEAEAADTLFAGEAQGEDDSSGSVPEIETFAPGEDAAAEPEGSAALHDDAEEAEEAADDEEDEYEYVDADDEDDDEYEYEYEYEDAEEEDEEEEDDGEAPEDEEASEADTDEEDERVPARAAKKRRR